MLLDSNIIIYAILPEFTELRAWCISQDFSVSEITKLEVLGYWKLSSDDKQDFEAIFATAVVRPLSSSIIDRAVFLRQQRKMSLGDSLIAATAIEYNETLATRNVGDFIWIEELEIVNPFE